MVVVVCVRCVTSERRYDINLITRAFMLEGADPGGPNQTITLRESMKIIPGRRKRTVGGSARLWTPWYTWCVCIAVYPAIVGCTDH